MPRHLEVRDTPAPRVPPEPPEYFDRDPSVLRLDNNTNPRVHPAIRRVGTIARTVELNRYGTAWGGRLRAALARYYDLPEASIFVGAGSDEILDAAARTFLGPGRRGGMTRPGYDIHASLIARSGADLREAFLGEDGRVPASPGWARGLDLLFLASPSNPTGVALRAKELAGYADAVSGVAVVDEAYAEYGGPRLWRTGLARKNVLFTRTFSKAWGLAGLRVGYGVAHPELVERIRRYRIPFTLNTLSEEIARAALASPAFVRRSVAEVRSQRPRLAELLRRLGFTVHPSDANFLLVDPPVDGEWLFDELRRRRILLRRIRRGPRGPVALRVTIGTPREIDRLDRTLRSILGRSGREPALGRWGDP